MTLKSTTTRQVKLLGTYYQLTEYIISKEHFRTLVHFVHRNVKKISLLLAKLFSSPTKKMNSSLYNCFLNPFMFPCDSKDSDKKNGCHWPYTMNTNWGASEFGFPTGCNDPCKTSNPFGWNMPDPCKSNNSSFCPPFDNTTDTCTDVWPWCVDEKITKLHVLTSKVCPYMVLQMIVSEDFIDEFVKCFEPGFDKNFLKCLSPGSINYLYKKLITDVKVDSMGPLDFLYPLGNALTHMSDPKTKEVYSPLLELLTMWSATKQLNHKGNEVKELCKKVPLALKNGETLANFLLTRESPKREHMDVQLSSIIINESKTAFSAVCEIVPKDSNDPNGPKNPQQKNKPWYNKFWYQPSNYDRHQFSDRYEPYVQYQPSAWERGNRNYYDY